MTRFARITIDCRGASLMEFALVLPALVLFIYGTFIFGQLLEANAGMQHALGEGARYTTLCLNPTTSGGCTVPSDTQITNKINSSVFGAGMGTFTVATPVTGSDYKDLSVTYTMPMNFIFFHVPNVTLTQTKRVYTA
jgi:Flp pilus assembly protein TadG